MSRFIISKGALKIALMHLLGPFYLFFMHLLDLAFPFVVPNGRYFWVSILSFLGISAVLYLRRKPAGEPLGPEGFLEFVFPRKIYCDPAAFVSYRYYFVYGFLNVVTPYGALLLTADHVAPWVQSELAHAFGSRPVFANVGGPALNIGFTLVLFLALDLGFFVCHVFFHKIPALWEFHKVHHCVTAMTPIAGTQSHPVESALQGVSLSLFGGAAIGLAHYLFRMPPSELTLFGASALLLTFNLLFQFRHSHIWLTYPVGLSHIFSSPAMHQIHHSTDPKHFDRNFGESFSFWDWIYGSLYVPRSFEKIVPGLTGEPAGNFDSVRKLLVRPFFRAARLLGRSARRIAPSLEASAQTSMRSLDDGPGAVG